MRARHSPTLGPIVRALALHYRNKTDRAEAPVASAGSPLLCDSAVKGWGGQKCPPLHGLCWSGPCPESRIRCRCGGCVGAANSGDASTCHPEAPSFGAEGPMQSAGVTGAVDESIGPSARKERGPQDDRAKQIAASWVAKGGRRLPGRSSRPARLCLGPPTYLKNPGPWSRRLASPSLGRTKASVATCFVLAPVALPALCFLRVSVTLW